MVYKTTRSTREGGHTTSGSATGVSLSLLESPQFLRAAVQVTLCVFKVTGETNTDDLSPAPDAWSRPDIPLHALAMLQLGKFSHGSGHLWIFTYCFD